MRLLIKLEIELVAKPDIFGTMRLAVVSYLFSPQGLSHGGFERKPCVDTVTVKSRVPVNAST